MKRPKKLVIVDGNAVVHRAYHALPPLSSPKGEAVHAVYGFTSILLKVLADLKPDYLVVCFDRKEPTFRHKQYAAYKATRAATPDDLEKQFPYVRELLDAFKIPRFEYKGYEADDLIAAILKAASPEVERVIVTGDLDELQLISPNTKVYTMRKGISESVLYDAAEVEARFGFPPEHIIDYKALRGDPSDNIPGVRGIGEVTAQKLIQSFGSLEAVYERLEEVTPRRVRELLTASKSDAFLSKGLATIRDDAPVSFSLDEAVVRSYDTDEVVEAFRRFGFKSLLARLPKAKAMAQAGLFPEEIPRPHLKKTMYHTVTADTFPTVLQTAREQQRLIIDVESTNQKPLYAELVGISCAWKEGEGFYLPFGHEEGANLGERELTQFKNAVLENEAIEKIGHNLKYDALVFRQAGIALKPLSFDTMLAAYLLNPGSRAQSLSTLAFSEFGIRMIPIDELIGTKTSGQISFAKVPIDKATMYAVEDADLTLRLYHSLRPRLEVEPALRKLFYDMEMPLLVVLEAMEARGVKIDVPFLAAMSEELAKKIAAAEKEIYRHVGYEFNIGSPAQLKEALFGKLQLVPSQNLKRLKTGLSTAAAELEKLRGLHPVIDHIFEYREFVKLKTTYVDALPALINPTTGRIHTSFNQSVTQTGRLSSSNPNLQNIPIKTDLGEEIRRAFVAAPRHALVAADYSQIELRIVAHLAGDEEMSNIFAAGRDIHQETAALVYGVPAAKVENKMRRLAKVVNFGVLYGMSSFGVAQATGLSRGEAQSFIDGYFAVFSGVAAFIERIKEEVHEKGYVETLFGRRRYLPEIHSPNQMLRAAAERMAVNMPVQGTQADIIKIAMVELHRQFPELAMLLQVHDELVFEVPKGAESDWALKIKTVMEAAASLRVPLVAEVKAGPNWRDMKTVEVR